MSKLARVLTISVVLAVLSLGATAHAEESDPPQPAGITQPDPPPAENPPAENPPSGQTPPVTKAPPTVGAPLPRPSTRVTVTPRSGRPGTTVTLVADFHGTCDPAWTFFQDRKQLGNLDATKPATIVRFTGCRLVARYTVSSADAAGWGRFGLSCDMRTDTDRVDSASFRVLPAASGGTVTRTTTDGDGAPVPDQVDPELSGATGATEQADGLDSIWLLVPTGLLLVVLAVVLRLLHTTRLRH
jgi:hypothetical protein